MAPVILLTKMMTFKNARNGKGKGVELPERGKMREAK